MTARLRAEGQKMKQQHPLIIVGIIIVLVVLIAFIFAAYNFHWEWTGLRGGVSKVTTTMVTPGTITTTPETTVATEQQPAKTLWDWLGLLAAFAIPVVVGLGAAWYTAQQGKVSARENTDNQREAALQAYIDKISELLLAKDNPLCDPQSDAEERKIARVRTLTILPRLDANRKRSVLQFLYESGLINKSEQIIDLSGADLSEANLRGANLKKANLKKADLSGADLSGADLSGAQIWNSLLYEASLIYANLKEASLRGLDLEYADLRGVSITAEQSKDAKRGFITRGGGSGSPP